MSQRSIRRRSRTAAPSGPIPVGDGAGLLKRRPDVRQAERVLAGRPTREGRLWHYARGWRKLRRNISAGRR